VPRVPINFNYTKFKCAEEPFSWTLEIEFEVKNGWARVQKRRNNFGKHTSNNGVFLGLLLAKGGEANGEETLQIIYRVIKVSMVLQRC
jgi:hypothetical protein